MSGNPPAVEFRSVTKVFGKGADAHVALDDIDLRIEQGEIFGVIGYSGAGKSTLVRLINALERPTSGSIEVAGGPPHRGGAGGGGRPGAATVVGGRQGI